MFFNKSVSFLNARATEWKLAIRGPTSKPSLVQQMCLNTKGTFE